jgi:thiosulfate dehydrogenase (quinone) large subunit
MKRISFLWVVLIQWVLAYEWLHSGWGKWSSPGFITNISKTLEGFAAKTPYTVYGDFLRGTAIPNAELFGNMIRGGEVLVGLALVIGGLLLLWKKRIPTYVSWIVAASLFGGALMNLNFFVAAGWSSPAVWGVNMVMGLINLILAILYIKSRKDLAS